ncbi:Ubiquinone biosynthesis regulatory protein kinase UbiB [hydrothermal vent metagenome]|uniref:Ubiquinone biosynthesis regulatory protein kinase UbiB n=1 Tax=hydrothermal vent metagenome TaxID=652676 RepID=A0A3B1BUH1_9ZZZZ
MIKLSQLLRLLKISWVLVRHGLDELILATHLFRPVRFIGFFLPWHWLPRREQDRGVRIRRALEDLGPIFVKFGQILSTRRDLLPDDLAIELAKLQDQVAPFPGEQARAIIEKAYGCPLDEVFTNFEVTPLASASIAQVHAATLKNGDEVVIKVLRPDILPVIQRDIGLLYIIASKIERFWSMGKQLRPVDVVHEIEKTLLDELDLMREAANASQLRRNFENSELIYIPEVYWPHTRKNVMVLERISGIPVSNIDELIKNGIDLKTLSEQGVIIFFTQVFHHSFFHADMHPGNIFVAEHGQYIAVDFGIMGTLNTVDQRYLAENFLAFFNRDYHRVAELHVESGWVDEDTRVEEFESAIRTVCEPIFDKPLKDISFGQLLLRLFQTARRFNMEVQPQLILLQKTLLNIEGLGRQLYPELDLWQTAKPFLEDWIKDQIGPRAVARQIKNNLPGWLEKAPQMPGLFFDVFEQARSGKLKVEMQARQLETLRYEIRSSSRRSVFSIIGGSLIISAAVIFSLDGYSKVMAAGAPLYTWVLGALGIVFLLAAWPDD